MIRGWLSCASLVVVWLCANEASAQPAALAPTPDLWADRPLVASLAGSFWGSPIGLVGVTLEGALWQRVVVQVGVGAGWDRWPFWRYAASVRHRWVLDSRTAVSFGVGASMGYLTRDASKIFNGDSPTHEVRELWSRWIDGLVAYEIRDPAGWQYSVGVGVEFLMNEHQSRCFSESDREPTKGQRLADTPCSDSSRGLAKFLYPIFPFVGFSAGRAFSF